MMRNFKHFLSSIKNYKFILSSISENIVDMKNMRKVRSNQSFYINKIKKVFGTSPVYIKNNYMFVGRTHLEVGTLKGIMIENTHRLEDLFPNITFVDSNMEDLEDTKTLFKDSICITTFMHTPKIYNEVDFKDTTFSSISLNFVLEKIKSEEELDSYIKYLRSIVNNEGGLVFGISKNINLELIERISQQYFDSVTIETLKNGFMFRFDVKIKIKDITPFALNLENVGSKYLELG